MTTGGITAIVHADVLATMDDADREIHDAAILFADGVITAIGPTATLAPQIALADEVVDAVSYTHLIYGGQTMGLLAISNNCPLYTSRCV